MTQDKDIDPYDPPHRQSRAGDVAPDTHRGDAHRGDEQFSVETFITGNALFVLPAVAVVAIPLLPYVLEVMNLIAFFYIFQVHTVILAAFWWGAVDRARSRSRQKHRRWDVAATAVVVGTINVFSAGLGLLIIFFRVAWFP